MQTYLQKTKSVEVLDTIESIQDDYTHHIRAFTDWCRVNGRDVNFPTIRDYIVELNCSDYSANTKRIKRQAIKKRMRQLMESADVETYQKMETALRKLDNDKATKAPKINSCQVTRDMILTVDEYHSLVEHCRTHRQMAFVRFLMATACRVSEAIGIKIGHCKFADDWVSIRITGKGNKERFVKTSHELFDFIQESFRGEEYLFETDSGKPYNRSYVSAQIKKIGKLIGKNISAHTLRHSRITLWVLRYPGSLDAISRYVGHGDVSITLNMYCHSQMSDEMVFDLDEV